LFKFNPELLKMGGNRMATLNMTRREFSKTILAAAAAASLPSAFNTSCGPAEKLTQKYVALQLYTLRDLAQVDFGGTLQKVAEIDYDAVEFAGFGGLTAKQVHKLVNNLGLDPIGSHEAFDLLQQDLTARIDFNLEVGTRYLVCPMMPEEWRQKGIDGIKEFADKMNQMGEQIKKSGLVFCYHNHAFEFEKIEGKYMYDHLFEAMDADLVKAEIDVYWDTYGGEDPVAPARRSARHW
jgi:sugar phosphate isomerase/epimerase